MAGRFFTSALGSPRFATPTNKILLIIPQVKLIKKKKKKVINMICHQITSHPIFREKYLKHLVINSFISCICKMIDAIDFVCVYTYKFIYITDIARVY